MFSVSSFLRSGSFSLFLTMSRCTFLNDELFPSLFFNLDLRRLDPTVAAEIEAEYLSL